MSDAPHPQSGLTKHSVELDGETLTDCCRAILDTLIEVMVDHGLSELQGSLVLMNATGAQLALAGLVIDTTQPVAEAIGPLAHAYATNLRFGPLAEH